MGVIGRVVSVKGNLNFDITHIHLSGAWGWQVRDTNGCLVQVLASTHELVLYV